MNKNELVRAPKSIEELQKEVARLDASASKVSTDTEREARLEGIKTFRAAHVETEINLQATIMENIAHKFYTKEVELKSNATEHDQKWSLIYGESARGYDDCATMLRKAMTSIISIEKYRQNITNQLNK
jgi:hypothetical protein